MTQSPQNNEALNALERLYAKKVITLEEGQTAARLVAKDEAYTFPAPKPAPPPAQPEPAAAEPAPASEAPAAGSANGDGTSPG